MKSLRSSWKTLERRLKRARQKILLLDFDGTLAPIAKTPETVRLDAATHRALEKLSRRPSWRIAIVSGRSLADLKKYFKIPRVILVGNHGLEAYPAPVGLSKSALRARKHSHKIGVLATKLSLLFEGWPGLRVENKTYTLSLHFRNVDAERQALLREIIDIYRHQMQDSPLKWRPGKKVWEVRPAGHWGKADVIAHFLKKFPKAFPIAVGDDYADEEMFEALGPRGISIRVGRSPHSSARYCVSSPREMRLFLEGLQRL